MNEYQELRARLQAEALKRSQERAAAVAALLDDGPSGTVAALVLVLAGMAAAFALGWASGALGWVTL